LTNASLYIGKETTQIYSVNNNKKSHVSLSWGWWPWGVSKGHFNCYKPVQVESGSSYDK